MMVSPRNMDQAQVILLGVSVAVKPDQPVSGPCSSRYPGRHNYPFTADDMDNLKLPAAPEAYNNKSYSV